MASAARPSANVAKAFASIPGSPFLCDGVFLQTLPRLLLLHRVLLDYVMMFFLQTLPRLLLLYQVLLDHVMVLMGKRKWACDDDVDRLSERRECENSVYMVIAGPG